MVMTTHMESNMTFQYDNDYGYRLGDATVIALKDQNKFKDCDFTIFNNDALYFIEAKASTPRPVAQDSQDPSAAFDNYIREITKKINDSVFIHTMIVLESHPISVNKLPKEIRKLPIKITAILVVKDLHEGSIAPVQDALKFSCQSIKYISYLKDIIVISEDTARKKKIII